MAQKLQIVLMGVLFLAGCTKMTPKTGVEHGSLAPCSTTPNCVSSSSEDKTHFIAPIRATGTSFDVSRDLLHILSQLKNTKIVVTQDSYIRAECTSAIFRFIDDVELYFPETNSEEMTIYVRSASRVGYSDFNVNRKRIEEIREKMKRLHEEKGKL